MNAEENYESEVPPSSVHQDGPLGGHGAPGYGGCMLLVDTTISPRPTFWWKFQVSWARRVVDDTRFDVFFAAVAWCNKKPAIFCISFFWLVTWAMSTLTQKMAQVQYFWVSEHFEWMFSLLTKDSEGNADVFFFPKIFPTKMGEKSSNRTALDRSRWSILIQGGYYQFPFHWGGCSDESICLWCPTPMDTDRSVPWFWNVSAWRRGHLGISSSSLCLVFGIPGKRTIFTRSSWIMSLLN